jgi:hypothetical protein
MTSSFRNKEFVEEIGSVAGEKMSVEWKLFPTFDLICITGTSHAALTADRLSG